MTKPTTQGERLIKIETLLEAKAEADAKKAEAEEKRDAAMIKAIEDVRADVKALRVEAVEHKTDYDRLKNRGGGILVGVAIAAGGIGAGVGKFWQWIAGLGG